jgi:hypothetical protein
VVAVSPPSAVVAVSPPSSEHAATTSIKTVSTAKSLFLFISPP